MTALHIFEVMLEMSGLLANMQVRVSEILKAWVKLLTTNFISENVWQLCS